jgi:spermidine synthase
LLSLPGSRRRVLILGGGDGLAAREVLKYADVEEIHLVDIDQEMTALCSTLAPIAKLNEGSLRDKRVVLHHTDAFVFVQRTTQQFDRVIIDLPDPHNEVLTKLYSVEFYKLLGRCLASGGAAVSQSTSPYFTREVFWCIAKTFQAASFHTHSYQVTVPSFGMWGFTLAAAEPLSTEFPISADKTRFLTSEAMRAAAIFGKDTERVESPVNSIFEPRLYQLYRRGVTR